MFLVAVAWIMLVHWCGTSAIDRMLMLELRGLAISGPQSLTAGFLWLSWVGNADQRTPLILLATLALYLWDQRRAALALPIAAFGSTLTANGVIKPLVARERPDVVPWLTDADGFSLPSGHATGSIAFLLIIWMLTAGIDTRSVRIGIRGGTVILVAGMGVSRVWLGVHWPSDIIAGWLWGGAFALAAVLCSRSLPKGTGQGRA